MIIPCMADISQLPFSLFQDWKTWFYKNINSFCLQYFRQFKFEWKSNRMVNMTDKYMTNLYFDIFHLTVSSEITEIKFQ